MLNVLFIAMLIYLIRAIINYDDIIGYIYPMPLSIYFLLGAIAISILSSVIIIFGCMKRPIKNRLSIGIVLALMIVGSITGIQLKYHYSIINFEPSNVEPYMASISLNELMEIHTNKRSATIYVGRPTCPICSYYEPYLHIQAKLNQIDLLYYNTEEDRYDNVDKLKEVLDIFKVDSVPTILVISEGEVTKKYMDEELLSSFAEIASFYI